ncbi:MAG: GNAT family N-acetyltransferase [Bacteroidales bacterium]|nr:GNAT family N-acetyltransferase [Bacteroidales bacterium]
MDGFTIRDYKTEDYEALIRVWQLTGMADPARGDNEEVIRRCINTGGKLFLLEDKNNKVIAGTSWLTFDGRRLYLHHFGLLPEYQGKGLSKYLLEKTLEYVKERGHQVKLEVERTNKSAISLYEKYGFKYLGDYLVYIIRDTENIT